MAFGTPGAQDGSREPFKSKNKVKRHSRYLKIKKARESIQRDERFRRKRVEAKNPRLRAQRLAKNVPASIDRKRTWDEVNDEVDHGTGLGISVDVSRFKRQRAEDEDIAVEPPSYEEGLTASKLRQMEVLGKGDNSNSDRDESLAEDDLASLMEESDGSLAENDDEDIEKDAKPGSKNKSTKRVESPAISTTSTNLSIIPDSLAAKFPTLFSPPETPKILVTTSLGGTIHREASLITELFPNSNYVPRQRHRYKAHHFSLREIAKFASNRDYTTLIVLEEDQKRPHGMTVIHLPSGPTFHFTLRNWIEGKKLPGHGNPTEHYPELVLNNFRTPLGILTAHLFRTLFPPRPELEGRQVITLHNQRDYIFVRRHRYKFRDKRATEKPATDADGKPIKGIEDVKAGLQELGPRFTLKLRRVDKGIQRASGQEWEWKAGMEKQRTKFQL